MAVDNDNFGAKLALRRHFLQRYHAGEAPHVFDACQATGQLWKALRAQFPVASYFGVDLAIQRGRLRVDSVRVLGTPGWQFDVIDVDTYGTPWKHWDQILKHGTRDLTVFLTMGRMNNTMAPKSVLRDLGLGRIVDVLPESLGMRLYPLALRTQFDRARHRGWKLVEVCEATKGKTAQYFGVRIERAVPTIDNSL